jgi:hypothetical protein
MTSRAGDPSCGAITVASFTRLGTPLAFVDRQLLSSLYIPCNKMNINLSSQKKNLPFGTIREERKEVFEHLMQEASFEAEKANDSLSAIATAVIGSA